MNVDDAVAIATEAHAGQVDKAGEPYIGHPLRVMRYVATEEERLVAVLHDTLEDTSLTADRLLELGCPKAVVDAIQILTRKPDDSYEAFIVPRP
ncbi:MAG: hypothetical protein ACRDH7_07970 [Actinomycetota bacterium]